MTKERLKKIVGENIRHARVGRNLSIDELAESLELTSGFVGLIERGHRGTTAYTLYKLSEIFDVTVDTFFEANSKGALKLAESTSPLKVKRAKVASLISDFNDAELDCVISIIKGIKNMRNKAGSEKETDDTENE